MEATSDNGSFALNGVLHGSKKKLVLSAPSSSIIVRDRSYYISSFSILSFR